MSKPAGAKLRLRPCTRKSQRGGERLACPLQPDSAAKGVLGLESSTSVPMLFALHANAAFEMLLSACSYSSAARASPGRPSVASALFA